MSFNTTIRGALTACAFAALVGTGVTGCAATVTATPVRAHLLFSYPVVRVESAPPRVHERPHVFYRGRDAYLVNGRWYYPADGGWVYFREEPTELRRYREAHADARDPVRSQRRSVEPPREQRRRRYYD
ncbi:MAG: hypothetical protein ABI895_01940 [Deltaproteobacteria bacterium]